MAALAPPGGGGSLQDPALLSSTTSLPELHREDLRPAAVQHKRPVLRSSDPPLHRWVASEPKHRERIALDVREAAADAALTSFVSHALTLSAQEALATAVSMLPQILPRAQHAHFLELHDADGEETAVLRLTASSSERIAHPPPSCPVREGVLGWVARSGVPSVEVDASVHLSYSRMHEAALLGRSSIMCVPVGSRAKPMPPRNTIEKSSSVSAAAYSSLLSFMDAVKSLRTSFSVPTGAHCL